MDPHQSLEINDLRILMLEDVPSDAELEKIELQDAGLVFTSLRVDTREAFELALDEFKPNIILVDYNLPAYNGRDALEYTRRTHPQIPVIIVTGALGDEAAVELLKLGARDYVLKGGLARLAPAIKRALSEERGIRSRKLAEAAVRESEARYKRITEGLTDYQYMVRIENGRAVDTRQSPACVTVTGYRAEEFIANPDLWIEMVVPDDREMVIRRVREVQAGKDVPPLEHRINRKDGELRWVSDTIVLFKDASGKLLSYDGVIRDITQRKQAEREIKDEKEFSENLIRSLPNIFYLIDQQGSLLEWNKRGAELLGLTPEQKSKVAALTFIHEEDRPLIAQKIQQAFESGFAEVEARLILKNGVRHYMLTATRIETRRGIDVVGVGVDITERKNAEAALSASEEKIRTITTSAQDAIVMLDNEGKISFWNPAAERIFGHLEHEALGKPLHELVAPKRFLDGFRKSFGHFQESGEGPVVGKTTELAGLRKDGTEFPLELSLSAIKKNGLWNAIGIVRDISERKAADAGLKLFRALIDHSSDAIEVNDPETFRFIDVNETSCRTLGYNRDELLTMRIQDVDPNVDEPQLRKIGEALQAQGSVVIETRHRRKDGSTFPVEVSVTSVRLDREYAVSMVRDITERKLAEATLQRLNHTLRALSAGNHALVHAESEKTLLENMCRATAEAGYVLAWVGYALPDVEKNVLLMAMYGEGSDYLKAQENTWGKEPSGLGPTGSAISSRQTQVVSDIQRDPRMGLWREAAAEYGYASCIALPLKDDGQMIGALTIYAAECDAFSPDQVELLEEMASDLSYGIVTLRLRIEHEQHATILRQSLEQSIQTIATTVEARDPYTAGHQRRVAELAVAIAREMGLPDEQVNGIHLAAIIHDLGKIHIPAEILSKPGKLNNVEYMLIKMHPQAGYDILKDVKFPWPIADIILQHHEKLDGSGYPQGLKDEEIMLEARILSVADVVEAMSSHRPYRPGLGIEAALDNIIRLRGVSYDPKVVDVCVALFREKEYVIPD